MTFVKRLCLFGMISFLLAACGGGGNGEGGGGTPEEQIIGNWLSPCTNIIGIDFEENIRITLTFNTDQSMKFVVNYYQEDTCENLVITGDITKEVTGTYLVGPATPANDGGSANELDIIYGEVRINGATVDADLGNVNLVVFRISGNRFYSDNLDPDAHSITRYNTIYPYYYYTRQ